jgi:hypothetical protein
MKKKTALIRKKSHAHAKMACRAGLLTSCIFLVLFFSSCDEDFVPPPAVITSENFVDLRPQQSALKDQGGRSTCIVFSAVAAVEANYKKLGYGELDLSEEFINYARKAF